jgi:hypothetical protein
MHAAQCTQHGQFPEQSRLIRGRREMHVTCYQHSLEFSCRFEYTHAALQGMARRLRTSLGLAWRTRQQKRRGNKPARPQMDVQACRCWTMHVEDKDNWYDKRSMWNPCACVLFAFRRPQMHMFAMDWCAYAAASGVVLVLKLWYLWV